jgi:hypothetical protein
VRAAEYGAYPHGGLQHNTTKKRLLSAVNKRASDKKVPENKYKIRYAENHNEKTTAGAHYNTFCLKDEQGKSTLFVQIAPGNIG